MLLRATVAGRFVKHEYRLDGRGNEFVIDHARGIQQQGL